MKIQYCSDLHLEFRKNKEFLQNNPLIPKGDILMLAGDIVPFKELDKHGDFFDFVSDHFKACYWIPGNHEYYHSDIAERGTAFNEAIRSNVFLVNNQLVRLEGIKILLTTLWTHLPPSIQFVVQQGMADFHLIKNGKQTLTPDLYNLVHEQSLAFLKDSIDAAEAGKTIVITHHVPTFEHYPEKYRGNALCDAFAIELRDWIAQTPIDHWVYGHHHHNTSAFKIGNTTMLTNQLGYVKYGENINFKCDCILV